MNHEINQNIKRFFWDVNPNSLDLEKNSEYIIARILEYGDPETIIWLFKTYDKKIIKNVLINKRGFSRESANFWGKILEVDKSKSKKNCPDYLKTSGDRFFIC